MDRNILKEALIGVNGRRDVDLLVSLSKHIMMNLKMEVGMH